MSTELETRLNCPQPREIFGHRVNFADRQTRYQKHDGLDLRPHENTTERFYSCVWPYAQMILRAAHYLVRDSAEADDIAQETMIKAFKGLSRFEDGTNISAWLMTILRHTRIDHFRAAALSAADVSLERLGAESTNRAIWTEHQDEPGWENPDELLESFSDHHVIQALRSLPKEIRWTLLLVEVEEMDHEDAAKVLGVPVGTVKSRAFRGRAMLRHGLLSVAKELRLAR
jgi:RNA polymerase sigma-70 factor (ECF subfamily)